MLTPVEMQRTLPMTLHGGAVSTTTEVWAMLSACRAGDLAQAQELMAQRPELATCQYNYTPPLHFAVREGHSSSCARSSTAAPTTRATRAIRSATRC